MPPMGRILSLSALLHVSAATPFLTAPLGLPAAEAHGEEPVGPNVELANRTHPGRGLEFATVPGRMTYSGSTGVNIDGGYTYGDPRRYTRGWALSNGLGDPALCDALCKAQPECQSPGNTCTSQAYEADGGRCYCSYASTQAPPCGTNQHVSNGRCVACPPGTTSSGGDDPSEGKDTGCECASTITLARGTTYDYVELRSVTQCETLSSSSTSNTHSFNPANGELVIQACVDTIEGYGTFKDCAQIKKVTFLHTVSNPVIIENRAFANSGVEIVDVPPRATFKEQSFYQANSLKRLDFRADSDYSLLKIEAQAFSQAGLAREPWLKTRQEGTKEVVLCVPLACASTPPSA